MQKWEYLHLLVNYGENGKIHSASTNTESVFKQEDHAKWQDLQSYLDTRGAQGWEMVTVAVILGERAYQENYYFKRPVEEMEPN